MIAAIKGEDRVSRHIADTPALASIRAVLMNSGARQIVVVGHDGPAQRIIHAPQISLDVKLGTSRVVLVQRFAGTLKAIV